MTAYEKLRAARGSKRPTGAAYVKNIFTDCVELHGDREGMDDRAIIGGLAKIDGRPVMIIGTMKGKSTKENLEYNFGMPQPQGYRKALRLFKHASKFNMKIALVSCVDYSTRCTTECGKKRKTFTRHARLSFHSRISFSSRACIIS